MGFQFLHGALLWGVGLIFLPILIHLLRRRLVRRHRLPTFEFLLRTQRRITNRSRLRNWILLFLRVCAVGVAAFLASRPLLATEGSVSGGGWFPVSTVVVVDNSASMAFSTPRGSRLDVARRAVRRMIAEMSESDRMSVAATVGRADDGPMKELNPEDALSALDGIRQTDGKGAPARVVRRALESASTGARRKNVVVFSDFAQGDWKSFQIRNLKQWNPHVHVQFVRVAPEAGSRDMGLRDVKMKPWPPKAGFPFTIGARVFNRGDENKSNVPVRLYMGEELKETIKVDVGPRGSSPVSFRVNAPRTGALHGRLELPKDSLPATNRFYFAAGIGKRLRALIIDGDPKRGLQDSETFFIVNALSAARLGGESPVLTRVVASYELNSVKWDDYDYAVACNVGRWSEGGRQGLRSFVEKGGGLLWATGELASSGEGPGPDWLPAAPGAPASLRPSGSLKITRGAEKHPAFSLLGKNGARFFSALRLARITPLEPARGGRALLELPDGTPVLVVGSVGSGRVVMWGSTCDRDWTDLAVRPVFVPFIRGISDFLGGAREGAASSASVGRAFEIRAPVKRVGEAAQIRGPGGEGRALQFVERTSGDAPPDGLRLGRAGRGGGAVAHYRDAYRAGFYRILTPDEEYLVAANVPALEADISPMDMSELKGKIEQLDVRDLPADEADPMRSILGRIDLAALLFILLGGVLAAEAFLADRT